MTGRRALCAVAVGLVLAGLTATTFTGMLLGRPLPTIDGHFRLLGLHERAEVVRDVFGVPRIEAGDAHDLFFLQGYVTAQDRFAQMQAMREEAFGALVGPVPEGDLRVALEAYAEGVTKFISQHAEARALPAEIVLSGRRRPATWTPSDTLGIVARYLEIPSRSACVTVDGDRTIRGHPLLAADIEIDAPAPGWYEVGLEARGLRAIGLSLPGVPAIVAGHNGRVAWSFHARPGEPLDPVHGVGALLNAAMASEADMVGGPRAPAVELAGCAADTGGSTLTLAPSRGMRGGEVTVSGTEARTAQLMDATVGAGRGLDLERMRLVLGRAEAAAAAARIVIDLGDLDASKVALSTGQSGHRAAFHYRDQVPLWEAGQLHRLAWTRPAVARTEGQLVLRPR